MNQEVTSEHPSLARLRAWLTDELGGSGIAEAVMDEVATAVVSAAMDSTLLNAWSDLAARLHQTED